jgi:hypothetical protein
MGDLMQLENERQEAEVLPQALALVINRGGGLWR